MGAIWGEHHSWKPVWRPDSPPVVKPAASLVAVEVRIRIRGGVDVHGCEMAQTLRQSLGLSTPLSTTGHTSSVGYAIHWQLTARPTQGVPY
jgi:hypothetical protein